MKGRVAVLVAGLALGLGAPACGGDDDGATETTTETTTGEEVVAGDEVFTSNCGTCHTLSEAGTSGMIGPSLDDTSLTAEDIEAQVRSGGERHARLRGDAVGRGDRGRLRVRRRSFGLTPRLRRARFTPAKAGTPSSAIHDGGDVVHTDRIAGARKLKGREKWEAIKHKWSPIERAFLRETGSNGRRPLRAAHRRHLVPR